MHAAAKARLTCCITVCCFALPLCAHCLQVGTRSSTTSGGLLDVDSGALTGPQGSAGGPTSTTPGPALNSAQGALTLPGADLKLCLFVFEHRPGLGPAIGYIWVGAGRVGILIAVCGLRFKGKNRHSNDGARDSQTCTTAMLCCHAFCMPQASA